MYVGSLLELLQHYEGNDQDVVDDFDSTQDGAAEKEPGNATERHHEIQPAKGGIRSVFDNVRRLVVKVESHVESVVGAEENPSNIHFQKLQWNSRHDIRRHLDSIVNSTALGQARADHAFVVIVEKRISSRRLFVVEDI